MIFRAFFVSQIHALNLAPASRRHKSDGSSSARALLKATAVMSIAALGANGKNVTPGPGQLTVTHPEVEVSASDLAVTGRGDGFSELTVPERFSNSYPSSDSVAAASCAVTNTSNDSESKSDSPQPPTEPQFKTSDYLAVVAVVAAYVSFAALTPEGGNIDEFLRSVGSGDIGITSGAGNKNRCERLQTVMEEPESDFS